MKKTKTMLARCLTLLVLALISSNFVWGEEKTVTWTAINGGLGSGIGSGTIKTGEYGWNYERTLKSGDSYTGWTSNCIQLGKNGGVENVTFSTSSIPGTIKSVAIECSSYNNAHKVAIIVDGTTYKSATATAKWTTVGTITGTGTSSGEIKISVTDGTRAFYVKSISVTYEVVAPTVSYTVSFNPGTNGTCSTTSLTEASAGDGVTLPACTANDGFIFKGWAEVEDGNVVGQAGDTYKPASDCTLYAVYNALYTLTITQPADGGTLTVTDGTNALATGAKVEVGTNLTCEVTNIPEGKRFSRFYVNYDNNGEKYKATNPATFDNIPTEGITEATVTVTYQDLKKYTINYMVNGVNTDAQEDVYEGTALVFPTVGEFGGKVFVGWSGAEIAEATDIKPTIVETATLTATENTTYYAVFATLTKGDGETKTDVLDRKYTGVTDGSTTYKNWSKSSTSGATYAGNSAGSNNSIQLRWNVSDTSKRAGIVTTVSGGLAKKVTIEWNSETPADRTLNVYGSNTAFTSWEDVKTITSDPIGTIVKGESTTLNIDEDYQYIALRSNENALYLASISIDWVQGAPDSYSAYCTTVAPRAQDVEITSAGCATACVPFNATVSGAKAYYVTVEDEVAKLHVFEGAIPAYAGVLLKTEDDAAGTAVFTESTETIDAAEGNLMQGSVEGETFNATGYTYYVLSGGTNGVGFYWDPNTNAGGASAICPAGKAILAVPGNSSSTVIRFGDVTLIENVNAVEADKYFDLMGREVLNPAGGIYILNGKKVLVK